MVNYCLEYSHINNEIFGASDTCIFDSEKARTEAIEELVGLGCYYISRIYEDEECYCHAYSENECACGNFK